MAYPEPPENAAIFQFPSSYRRLMVGGLAVFVGLAVLGACLPLIDSKTRSVVIGAVCVIVVSGLFALLIARGFRRLSDRVAVIYMGQIMGELYPGTIDITALGLMMAGTRAEDLTKDG